MQFPERDPFIELAGRNAEAFTQLLAGLEPGKSLCKDAQDKEEAVAGVWDDGIREDGMGMAAAFTDQSEDGDLREYGPALNKVDESSAIVRMDMAVSGRATDGTGLPFRAERGHTGFKEVFG